MSVFWLKMLAVAAMLADHVGFAFRIDFLRFFGRLSMPLFCFVLALGFYHTKSRGRYLLRLLVFALLSEIPFDLFIFGRAFDLGKQNMLFTLALALLVLWLCGKAHNNLLLCAAFLAAGCAVGVLLRLDYGWIAILLTFVFYYFEAKTLLLLASGALLAVYGGIKGGYYPFALLALLPVAAYNGRRGPAAKYFFYLFYPLHMLGLYALRLWLG